MAHPRVFISSTCYDLAEVRDTLMEFIREYGFEPVLSENGDVFYHPDLHTHESCIREIATCQLFVLIIGGRFGGKYRADPNHSIVNAEYFAAKERNIPIFSFVKNDVHEDHRLFVKNRTNVRKIVFPSIEQQEYSEQIFKFIDEVRKSDSNNGYFSFAFSNEIKTFLRKQWSGMFYEFLQQRSQSKMLELTNESLSTIASMNEKIEDLTKNILRVVDKQEAEKKIVLIDSASLARQFFSEVRNYFKIKQLDVLDTKPLKSFEYSGSPWYSLVSLFEDFTVDPNSTIKFEGDKERKVIGILCKSSRVALFLDKEGGRFSKAVSPGLVDSNRQVVLRFERYYKALAELGKAERDHIVSENIRVVLF